MENHSPSQDDKPYTLLVENIFPLFNFLSQASEPNTDGIINTFNVYVVNRKKSSMDIILRMFKLGYFKTALRAYIAFQDAGW